MNRSLLLILMPMLGNNRGVINGTTGAVEQTVAYYPFGGVIADLGTPAGGQTYKSGCYPLSPYLYCVNDPGNAIDPSGNSDWHGFSRLAKYNINL
ncbi:MAG: hypothetical protein K2G85_04695 [Muribaculaceae bacterium]|nr:hypothetical protein [Muribaculaceae bacterium]